MRGSVRCALCRAGINSVAAQTTTLSEDVAPPSGFYAGILTSHRRWEGCQKQRDCAAGGTGTAPRSAPSLCPVALPRRRGAPHSSGGRVSSGSVQVTPRLPVLPALSIAPKQAAKPQSDTSRQPTRACRVSRDRGAPASGTVWRCPPTPTPSYSASAACASSACWRRRRGASSVVEPCSPDAGSREQPRSADGPVPLEPSRCCSST
jgi:hypothetical protein